MDNLNDALLWLAERRGKVKFGLNPEETANGINPATPIVYVEVHSMTAEECDDGQLGENLFGACEISRGRVVEALHTAINAARSQNA